MRMWQGERMGSAHTSTVDGGVNRDSWRPSWERRKPCLGGGDRPQVPVLVVLTTFCGKVSHGQWRKSQKAGENRIGVLVQHWVL